MNHLREEEFIDILMEEPHEAGLRSHLDQCPACLQKFQKLERGLEAARLVEPQIPLMPVRLLSHRRFGGRKNLKRFLGLAAAAMLTLSILGFRVEMSRERIMFQFSMLNGSSQAQEKRLAVLEQRLFETLELNAAITQSNLNAHLNTFYQERDEELDTFTQVLGEKMMDLELKNAQYLVNVKDDLTHQIGNKREPKGALQ